jgi:hypothetical protein
VICTGGGPTDEFTTDTFARRIPSRFHTEPLLEQALGVGARCLVPDTERFAQLIVEVAADVAWRGGAVVRACPLHLAPGGGSAGRGAQERGMALMPRPARAELAEASRAEPQMSGNTTVKIAPPPSGRLAARALPS